MAAAGSRNSSALWEWVRYLETLLIYKAPRLQCITETLVNSSLARRMILFLCVCVISDLHIDMLDHPQAKAEMISTDWGTRMDLAVLV